MGLRVAAARAGRGITATGTGSCSLGMMRCQVGMPLGKQLIVSHNLVGLDQAIDHALHVDEMLRATFSETELPPQVPQPMVIEVMIGILPPMVGWLM